MNTCSNCVRFDAKNNFCLHHGFIVRPEQTCKAWALKAVVVGGGSCTASESKSKLAKMEDWELGLYTEKEQLQDRFDKLGKFIDSNHYRALKTTECVLIESQYIAMCNYLNAIKWRIELVEKRIKDNTP